MTNAKAKIAVDQAVLARTQLLAPFDGTVTEIDTQPGDAVSAGTPALVLADLSSLKVLVQVSEVDINRVKLGQEVDLTLDAVSGQAITGIVIGVAAVVAMLGIGRGAQASITSNITSIGTHLLFVRPGSTSSGGVRTAQGSAGSLTLDDANALLGVAGAASLAPVEALRYE